VLEKMFFLPVDFPDPSKTGLPETEKYLVTRLGFKGPFQGYFLFFTPEKFTPSLTAGFLGEDEQRITEEHRAEMVKEVVNMIAGNTFSILDDKAIFNLDIPEVVDRSAADALPGSKESVYIPIQTVDGFLAIRVVLG
jgi:CheY-specific phosphatase CheX